MKQKSGFSGQIGFVFAAAGSAVGVGNLWRFPYLAAKDGGGLFLIIYLVLVLTFGFTLLTTDIAIGRKTGKSAIYAYESMRKKWKFLGILTFLVPVLIMTYYAVIGGWILKYITIYLFSSGKQAVDDNCFTSFISSPSSVWFGVIFMLLTALIVYNGVEKGIERVSKFIMPILLVMVIGIAIFSLTLKNTLDDGTIRTGIDGLKVYLTPDLSGLTVSRFLQITLDAMSQLFFSLSVSMGIMITYGSYVKNYGYRCCIFSRCYDYPGCLCILWIRRNVRRSWADVCFSAKSILQYGICRQVNWNCIFRACRICSINFLYFCIGIYYCELYGIISCKKKNYNKSVICYLLNCNSSHCSGIQYLLCGSQTSEWKYRTVIRYYGLYQ